MTKDDFDKIATLAGAVNQLAQAAEHLSQWQVESAGYLSSNARGIGQIVERLAKSAVDPDVDTMSADIRELLAACDGAGANSMPLDLAVLRERYRVR